jgi:hypothetical protein
MAARAAVTVIRSAIAGSSARLRFHFSWMFS